MDRSQPSWRGLRIRGISLSLAVWPALGGITLVRAGADGMKATRPWLGALIARASDDPAELSIDTLGLH